MAAVDVARKAAANIREPAKARRAVVAAVHDQEPEPEKAREMRAVGQAQPEKSLVEIEAMVEQDDPSTRSEPG